MGLRHRIALAILLVAALAPAPSQARRSPLQGVVIACGFDRRCNRLEVTSALGLTEDGSPVRHHAASVGLVYWFTNDLGLGIEAQAFDAASLDSLDRIASAYGRAPRWRRYGLGGMADLRWAVADGKLKLFDEIVPVDLVISGGAGVTDLHVIPPSLRGAARAAPPSAGDDALALRLDAGVATRAFLGDSFTIGAALHGYAIRDPAGEAWVPGLLLQVGVSVHFGPMRRRCRVIVVD